MISVNPTHVCAEKRSKPDVSRSDTAVFGPERVRGSPKWSTQYELMATSDFSAVSFDEYDTRRDEMHSTIEHWIGDLTALTDEARASQQFQKWLDVQSKFHDYSHWNTLLITLQCPNATKVAGYNTWRTEFDRHVQEGENGIWIWAPIITKRCPECENSPSYHEQSECEYDELSPEAWSKGLVGIPASYRDRPRVRRSHLLVTPLLVTRSVIYRRVIFCLTVSGSTRRLWRDTPVRQ